VVGKPEEIPEVQRACQLVIDGNEGKSVPLAPLERHAFYARAREAFGIVLTGELRPYGCILVKKGVVL
jgi:L-fucose mutarotase